MKTVNVKELKNLRLIKIMIEKFNQEEITLEALLELRNFALVVNKNELFYTEKAVIDELTKFIDKKINEINQ